MSVKRLAQFAMLATAMCAAVAFAQKPQAPGTHITVSKTGTTEYPPMYNSIQEAVNAARAGQVIEILDTSTYSEQVTIDGRDESPWPGVEGGKNGITIRYVPPSGTPINSGFKRPTIKYQDKTNVSPKTSAEAQQDGELPGRGGNFETCGALRIIRAEGVTIEGIAIDGGGPAPFGYTGVWCPPQGGSCSALTHGNAALTLVVAGGATIRNCDIKNAFIGVNVKDRNTGGVFGNPNPADNDLTIPLSGFGRVGYHLIEQNRIHNNSTGIFFESAWDLSNTVRYNLIYNNYHVLKSSNSASTITKLTDQGGIETIDGISGAVPDGGNMIASAIMFKDMVYTPIAIYNNTFYRNANTLVAHWKVGATHLLFNNIFSESNGDAPNYMSIEHRFPNRMHNSAFAANERIQTQCQNQFECEDNPVSAGGCFVDQAVITNKFDGATRTRQTLKICNNGSWNGTQTQGQDMTVPGALIPGGSQTAYPIPSAANVFWLEMTKRRMPVNNVMTDIPGTYNMFESTDPADAKFLWPKWDDTLVIRLIKNKGWTGANIRNADGLTADIGAISSAGGNNMQPATVARIKPTNVVMISGTTARASFYLNVDAGTLNNPTIKFLRWVAPLPNACKDNDPGQCNWAGDDGGQSAIELRASAITDLTAPATALNAGGTNSLTFTLPSALTSATKYGFFEIVVEGTDANGNVVRSDVGFLPYRELTHRLEICVQEGSSWNCGTGSTPPSVNAGELVQLRVTAQERNSSGAWVAYNPSSGSLPVTYRLLSHSTARMWREINSSGIPRNPLDSVANLQGGTSRSETYPVYFTRAGAESISAAGKYGELPLLGELQLKVNAGDPDRVAFIFPVPKSDGVVTTITGQYAVEVMVQDKFDNPVNKAVPVTVTVHNAVTGDPSDTAGIAPATASTDTSDGIARFTATVKNAKSGDLFDLYASVSVSGASKAKDTASMRVGRATDKLEVFYGVSTPPAHGDPSGNKGGWWVDDQSIGWPGEENEEEIPPPGTWVPVWVKVVSNAADTVIDDRSAVICVTASPPTLQFSGSADGSGAVSGQYGVRVTDGVARFWVTSEVEVRGGSLVVSARDTTGGAANACGRGSDFGITEGTRGEITFVEPPEPPPPPVGTAYGQIDSVYVKGDGQARPDYVRIKFSDTRYEGNFAGLPSLDVNIDTVITWTLPDSVTLKWPCSSSVAVKALSIETLDGFTLGVTFPAGSFPADYSGLVNGGAGQLTVYGAVAGDTSRHSPTGQIIDSIGPLIARSRPAACGFAALSGPYFPQNKFRETQPDTLRIQITETPKNLLLLEGKSIEIKKASGETGQLDIAKASGPDSNGYYVLELSLASPPLADGDSIRFDTTGGVRDVADNGPHSENRWVVIKMLETPAAMREPAWYTINNSTGHANYVYITLDKDLAAADIPAWFEGVTFSFNWDNVIKSAAPWSASSAYISLFADRTIRVDLAEAFPETRNAILTSGKITVTAANSRPPLEQKLSAGEVEAADSAAPVLISDWTYEYEDSKGKASKSNVGAVLHIGGVDEKDNYEPDMLVLMFSEVPNDNIYTTASPVSVMSAQAPVDNVWTPVKVETVPVPVGSGVGTYYRITYMLPTGADSIRTSRGAPKDGDSVKINEAANVSDGQATPNVQGDPLNRRVRLTVIPGKANWRFKVKNNPFNSSNGGFEVTMMPAVKGDVRDVKGRIRVFDNMGNVVVVDSVDNGDGKNGNTVVWLWDGRTKLPNGRGGRYVGTGTYILRADYVATDPKTKASDVRPEIRKIGFVRGNNKQ